MARVSPGALLALSLCVTPALAQAGADTTGAPSVLEQLAPGTWSPSPPAPPPLDLLDPLTNPYANPRGSGILEANESHPVSDPAGAQTAAAAALWDLHNKTEGPFGSLTAQVAWCDPREARVDPTLENAWKTEGAWRLEVAGPLFLFGQLGAAAPDPAAVEEMKVNGNTGVGCKLPVGMGVEVQLRGGPRVSYADPLLVSKSTPPALVGVPHSELFLEFQCRCPLPWQLGLQFQGAAVPALSPQDHDRISQDLSLAVPLGAGEFRLGAKRQWENVPAARGASSSSSSWMDGMELYVGFELTREVKK